MGIHQRKWHLDSVPSSILSKLKNQNNWAITEKLLEAKDYSSLDAFIKSSSKNNGFYYWEELIRQCCEELDVNALKIAVKYIPKGQLSLSVKTIYNEYCDDFFAVKDGNLIFNSERKDFFIKAIKVLTNKMDKFTNEDLTSISQILTKEDFYQLVKKASINLEDEQYKNLDLSHYKISDMTPLGQDSSDEKLSIIDVFMSRTYSDDLSKEKIEEVYQNLLSIDNEIITKMMKYVVQTMFADSNDLAIVFKSGAVSSYDSNNNIIEINTDTIKVFNDLELAVVHELAHHFFDKIFDLNSVPFDFNELKTILDLNAEFAKTDSIEGKIETVSKIYSALSKSELLESTLYHAKAGLSFVAKAGEILGCEKPDTNISTKLMGLDTSDYIEWSDKYAVEYAKFFCPSINFLPRLSKISFQESRGMSHALNENSPDEVMSLMQLYVNCSEQMQGIYEYGYEQKCKSDLSFVDIQKFVMEKCLPKIITDRHLDDDDLYFIERVEDWVGRGEDIFTKHEPDNNPRHYERDVELIVRLPEMVAAGIKPSLIDAMKPMQDYWDKFVIPKMDAYIASYEQQCLLAENHLPCFDEQG